MRALPLAAAALALLASVPAPDAQGLGDTYFFVGSVWYIHTGAPDAQACVKTRPTWTPGDGQVLLLSTGPGTWQAVSYWFSQDPLFHCHIVRTCSAEGDLASGLVGTCPGAPMASGTFRLTPVRPDTWDFVEEMAGPSGTFDHMDGWVEGGPLLPLLAPALPG